MITRKSGYARRHYGIFLVIPQIRSPGPRGAVNQSPRLAFAKLQHEESCKIVGGIFLMSEYGHVEHIECCVSDLMESSPEKLSNGRIRRGESDRIAFVSQQFQCAHHKFITESHRGLEIFLLIIGIHRAAFSGLDG